jgi:hypothetical protein
MAGVEMRSCDDCGVTFEAPIHSPFEVCGGCYEDYPNWICTECGLMGSRGGLGDGGGRLDTECPACSGAIRAYRGGE